MRWSKILKHTVMHWQLDVHAVDRDDSSVLQLHCRVLQGGQAERYRARAYGILVICTLNKAAKSPTVKEKRQRTYTRELCDMLVTCTFSMMTEKLLSSQSLASRYWQRPVKV